MPVAMFLIMIFKRAAKYVDNFRVAAAAQEEWEGVGLCIYQTPVAGDLKAGGRRTEAGWTVEPWMGRSRSVCVCPASVRSLMSADINVNWARAAIVLSKEAAPTPTSHRLGSADLPVWGLRAWGSGLGSRIWGYLGRSKQRSWSRSCCCCCCCCNPDWGPRSRPSPKPKTKNENENEAAVWLPCRTFMHNF